ncbi:MAG TPA: hypothetical protein VK196_11140 [Magnetospirillum sp.]|nr:hypothetical protein [Magnetospirillum sp.]
MMNAPALNRQTVEEIMGRLDDLKMAEILETGASTAELLEAKRWTAGDKRPLPDALPLRLVVIDRLCDIIRTDEPDWYDNDRG